MGKLLSGIVDGNAIANIYDDYDPAYKNLYTIEIYHFGSNGLAEDSISSYIKFHATDVTFDDESLDLERNLVTKNFHLKSNNSFKWGDTLSITWRESDDWRVKKYHENWVKNFYDKEHDRYYSYPRRDSNGNMLTYSVLYRQIKVTLPYSKINNKNKYRENTIVFENILPHNIGGFGFGWNANSEIISHKLDYYVKTWHWENTKELSSKEDNDGQTE